MPLFKRKKSTNPQFDQTYAKFKELEVFAKQLRLDLTMQMDTIKQVQAAVKAEDYGKAAAQAARRAVHKS